MAQRDDALDFVKGFLVIAMVLYHAMNYFSTAEAAVYGYLRFVNGAFVFLAGYVCTMAVAKGSRSERVRASRRLLQRGLKLLALFTLLNLAIGGAGVTSYKQVAFSLDAFVADLAAIYATGDSPRIAFRILVPIAYTLLLAPMLLVADDVTKGLRAALVTLCIAAAALYPQWLPFAPIPYFVLIGAVGAGLGLAGPARAAPHLPWLGVVAALALLMALMNQLSGNVLAYCAGLSGVLYGVWVLSRRLDLARAPWQATLLLGRYSLLAYIVQIVLLFGLYRLLGGVRWAPGAELLGVCAATLALLLALCRLLDRLRASRAWVDRGYRAVFA